MAFEKIESKIKEKGNKEVKGIEGEAKKESDSIDKGIKAEEEKANKKVMDKRKQELELIPKRIISNARMERKLQVDSKKAEIVRSVFEGAKKKILDLDNKKKEKLLRSLAEDAKKNVRDPVLYVDKKYSKLINAKTKDIGDFGVIVESGDGSMRVDNTLNNLMLRMEPDLKAKVGGILFGD